MITGWSVLGTSVESHQAERVVEGDGRFRRFVTACLASPWVEGWRL